MWRDRSLEVVIEGPAGTGKSRGILEKLHYCAIKYRGMRGLIVRKTRESLTESGLVTFEEQVLPEGSPIANGPKRETRKSYEYPNGSSIVVAGLVSSGRDQRAKVMSTEYDIIIVLEATELAEHEYEQLLTRLRNGRMPYQQLIADCNPDAPTHWLHQRCDRGVASVHFSRHQDNPRWYDHRQNIWTPAGEIYIKTVLGALSGVRRKRLLDGARAAAEGTVYEFDRAVHMIDAMPKGWQSWRKIRVIDFGYTNPFVCQWWAIDGDERMYLYREIYQSQTLVEDHQRQILALSRDEQIEATISDHDAEDRATLQQPRAYYCETCKRTIANATEETAHAGHTLRSDALYTVAASKPVQRGIEAVQARLRVQPDGKPRLFVLSTALVASDERLVEAKKPYSTAQEFDGYIWPKGIDGKPLKEEPVKLNDHGMDAMRYAVMYTDNPPGQGVFL